MQVRLRCPDGREPLDFATDETVRSLLLAEVEKLRMGLLDELLAEEESAAAAKEGKKSKKAKKAEKAAEHNKARAVEMAALAVVAAEEKAAAAVAAAAAKAAAKARAVAAVKLQQAAAAGANGTNGSKGAVSSGGGAGEEGDGKKKKKKKKKAEAEAASAASAGLPPLAAAALSTATPETVASPAKQSKGGKAGGNGAAVAHGSSNQLNHSSSGGGAGSSLFEAAVLVLSGGDADGIHSPMPVSSLISALYERSASFKEQIKAAGGAKTWLSQHAEEFELSCDGPAGMEQVKLRRHEGGGNGLPPPLPPPGGSAAQSAAREAEARARAAAALEEEGLPPPLPPPRPRSVLTAPQAEEDEGIEGLPPPLPPPGRARSAQAPDMLSGLGGFGGGIGLGGLLGGLGGVEIQPQSRTPAAVARNGSGSNRFGAIGSGSRGPPVGPGDSPAGAARAPAPDASLDGLAADENEALLADADADPFAIEKKIRAIQKKLRRVQEMEDRSASGADLDAGQKELLKNKAVLGHSLQGLLDQWAVLEPRLIQQQAARMAALANSECAVCLDEYDSERQAIRTSCCGEPNETRPRKPVPHSSSTPAPVATSYIYI